MLSHCEFPSVVQGIRDWLNARHKKSPPENLKSAQSVYASNTVLPTRNLWKSSFNNEINCEC